MIEIGDRFIVNETFEHFRYGRYLAGRKYRVTRANKDEVAAWVSEGRVTIDESAGGATSAGTMETGD